MPEIIPREELENLPENVTVYKCPHCKYVFDPSPISDAERIIRLSTNAWCPKCGSTNVDLLCKVDVYSIYLKVNNIVQCRKGEVISGVDVCPICDRPMCPTCYNHSCVSISRVTGYLQDISGWNEGKKQELMDRKRYSIKAV